MPRSKTQLSFRERETLLHLCRQVIAIDSTNPSGNLRLAEFFGEKFGTLGFQIKFQHARFCGVPQANLIARLGPRSGSALVLNTHLDTVQTDPSQWSKTGFNPFKATRRGGRLYGLGAADTKLAMACQWTALASLGRLPWRRPLFVTGTFGEEMGLVGAERLVKEKFWKGAQVLNSEPSELRLAFGNRGLKVFRAVGRFKNPRRVQGRRYRLEFSGKAAHSGRPHLGSNAILKALKYSASLPSAIYPFSLWGGLAANITAPRATLEIIAAGEPPPTPKYCSGKVVEAGDFQPETVYPAAKEAVKVWTAHFWPHRRGPVTQNIGKVNFFSGRWDMTMDLRIPLAGSSRRTELGLIHAIRSIHGHLKLERDNPPFLGSRKKKLYRHMARILRSCSLPVRGEVKGGATEASVYGSVAREVLTFGPGRLTGVAHQPNEYVEIRQLFEATLVYRELFRSLLGQ